MSVLSDSRLRISRKKPSPAEILTETRTMFDRQRTPCGGVEELRRLRDELAEKNRQISLLTRQINSPVFLLRAATRNLIRLVPYLVRRLHDRKIEKLLRRQVELIRNSHRRQVELIRNSQMFDEEWYLSQHPLVAKAAIDPIAHYLWLWMRERRQTEPGDYQLWIELFDSLTDAERAAIKSGIDRFSKRPLISILMPVYNTERQWLTRAIESVRAQLYPNWELCISDDASTSPHVKEILDNYAKIDERIRVFYRDTNGHISLNSNSALALATGEFIALMDDDDELAEHALFWVANEILCHPDVDLIYSDEDKIDVVGQRYDAYFKPDWNPALMLSQNMFSHLGVYRRSLVEKVGGFRAGFEGSQDHDLVLRCADVSAPERIRHISRVLYHWRARPGSTASAEAIKAKPYAWQAAASAIEEHLRRRGILGNVVQTLGQYYQINYQIHPPVPKVSIVMPTACKLQLLKPCVDSLFARTTYADFELLLVVSDIRFADAGQEAYLKSLKANPRIRILTYEDKPYNFSWLNNWAVAQSTGTVLCFMNDDIEIITPDWLEKLVARVQLEGVGAVGPMLYYPNETIQHAGVILGIGGVAGHAFVGMQKGHGGYFGRAALEQDLSCVTAACMVMRRSVFDELNGYDEKLAVAFNDVDLCIRMRRAGWRIIWTPQVEMYHHESASLGRHDSPKWKELFDREVKHILERWGDVLENDPFYNPNLSLSTNNFTLAFPPRIPKLPVRMVPMVFRRPSI